MIDWPVPLTENKYSRWYENLINKTKNRVLPAGVYAESHHIVPKSLKGSNSKKNLVHLTAKEHYIAHLLLWKMSFTKSDHIKMNHAFNAMCIMKDSKLNGKPVYRSNSRIFEQLKIERHIYFTTDPEKQAQLKNWARIQGQRPKGENFKRLTGLRFKGRTDTQGSKNGMYGRKHSAESIEKMKVALQNRVFTQEEIDRRNQGIRNSAKTCEYCGKTCVLSNYTKWHGQNCKLAKVFLPNLST